MCDCWATVTSGINSIPIIPYVDLEQCPVFDYTLTLYWLDLESYTRFRLWPLLILNYYYPFFWLYLHPVWSDSCIWLGEVLSGVIIIGFSLVGLKLVHKTQTRKIFLNLRSFPTELKLPRLWKVVIWFVGGGGGAYIFFLDLLKVANALSTTLSSKTSL